ncbi:MAG: aminotransferase class IV [Alphaproteobacteria bacterium]|nr:aminotransferase class IV [Alphaproteobacteria bacterium]
MPQQANERVAYHNGEIKPESRVLVSFRDRGFKYGEAVFDTARTVRHRPFRLEEHIDRLFRSMRYLQIDSGLSRKEMLSISHEVLERNLHLIAPDEDYWLFQRVSPGVTDPFLDDAEARPTVIVECTPLPLRARAPLFRDGVRVQIPATRRTPPGAVSPRAKTQNYINLQIADREARAQDPQAWAILLDHDGNLAEGLGSNIFCVRDGELLTPRARFVLPGISRETVIGLAETEGITVRETDLDLFDAFTSDECFLTSTSLCMVPVSSINGRQIAESGVPGPVTARLIETYKRLLDFDFVAQYTNKL